ncbi:MAG: HNH endonuclease [Bacteroidales bacterium]|nr:HNH endonuclease [Bacteroidales bacterium]
MAFLGINETWKELQFVDFEPKKKYAISDLGRVVRYTKTLDDGELLTQTNVGGYMTISIQQNRVRKSFYIHRLVAEYFVKRDETDEFLDLVIHLDYNKLNNKADNLRWVSIKDKSRHQVNSPNSINAREERKLIIRHEGHKLTSTEILRIKKKIWDPNRKTRMKMIAKEFGISEMQLYRIRSGENWSHIRVDSEPDWTKNWQKKDNSKDSFNVLG